MTSRHSLIALLLYAALLCAALILLAGCAGGPDMPHIPRGDTGDPGSTPGPGNTPGPADNTGNLPDDGNQSTPPSNTGTGSCADILSCVYQCPEATYETCEQGCISQGDANAQQLFGVLVACEEAAWNGSCQSVCQGTDTNACYNCLGNACATQYTTCEGGQGGDNTTPPPSTGGTGSCADILGCTDQCPNDDSFYTCEQGCMSQADAASQQVYQTLSTCWDNAWNGSCQSVCQGTDENACWTCLDNACMTQLTTCQGGQGGDNTTPPPATGGTGSCLNIMDCAFQCPEANFYACEQACMSQGDAYAQQLYGAIIACEEAALNGACLNACQGWDIYVCYDCLDNACMAQYMACEADV